MLMGAVAGFSTASRPATRGSGSSWRCWRADLLSLIHGVMTIHLRADQVVSGLALTFLGTGLARVLGEGVATAPERPHGSRR